MKLEADIKSLREQIDKLTPKEPSCPKCQCDLPEGAKFCYQCGAKVEE